MRGFHSRAIFSWVRWRWDLGLFQIFVVVVCQPEITKFDKITIIDITGASGLRGWIRLVEALWTPTIRTSISLLGGQHIQKQLNKCKQYTNIGVRIYIFIWISYIYPSLLSPIWGDSYIGVRGFHSRAIFSWVRWRWDLGLFQICVVAIFRGRKSPDFTKSANIQ